MKVLLVESGRRLSARLCRELTPEAVRIDATESGEEALELMRHYDFDLLLLNLLLSDMSGLDVLRRLRTGRCDTPVLAIVNVPQPQLMTQAFSAGADDVVAAPVESNELLARMRAIVRRTRGYAQPTLRVGAVSLNVETLECAVHDREVQLTGKEFAMLQLLLLRRNTVLTKETFLNHLYGGMDEPEGKIIDVFICKLRKKLAMAGASDVIGTVWGRGYTFRDSSRDGPPHPKPEIQTGIENTRSFQLARGSQWSATL